MAYRAAKLGYDYLTVIDKSTLRGKDAQIDAETYVAKCAVVDASTKIGNNVIINVGARIQRAFYWRLHKNKYCCNS